MTSLVVERFDIPGSVRGIRAFDTAEERCADVLGGRTVWYAIGRPVPDAATRELGASLGAGRAVAAAALPVQEPDERLRALAQKIDEMITGHDAGRPVLGRRDGRIFSRAATASLGLIGDRVCPGDVVVAHDVLSAALFEAVRDRGAHAVWRIRIPGRWINTARQALEFVGHFTPGIDAYLLSWVERSARGQTVERVAAAMPSAGIVATKEFPARFPASEPRRLAWRMALAEIVRGDRDEAVGGTLQPRPTVAAR
jgi:trehalose synthase